MGNMLGRTYKTIFTARWYCCPGHSLNNATARRSLKRVRTRERRTWRREVGL